MKRAIRTLKARIDILHSNIDKHQKFIDEPEMVCEYTFAMNDIANFQREISELQEAIQILNNHQIKAK